MSSRLFLLDIDEELNYCFVETSAEKIGRANFLERGKLEFEAATEQKISMLDYSGAVERRPVNFIFHTAFCGSTLLSRLLHNPLECVVLKEPHVLFRLSEASLSLAGTIIQKHLDYAVAELGQPWTQQGKVVIKPTNSCNRIASKLIGPDDRVVFLYSSLEDFMVSCLKKMPDAETRVNWMARHLLPGSKLEAMLDVPRNTNFSVIEACVLTWYVSLEYMSEALEKLSHDKCILLRYSDFKMDPIKTSFAVNKHFGISRQLIVEAEVKNRLLGDSKNVEKNFDSGENLRRAASVRAAYSDEINKGLHWADSYVSKSVSISSQFK